MSLVALARGCATRGSIGLRKMGLLPAAAPRRFMGGGGGHQPISRSMEAELFGGHPKEPEGWETTIYLTYGATVILLAFVGLAPDTSIKTVSHINLPPPPLVDAPTPEPPLGLQSSHNNFLSSTPLRHKQQWASSEARARLALQAEGKLDKPVFGVHYDTPENKFDFESVTPDNPLNEGRLMLLISILLILFFSLPLYLCSN